MTAPPTASQRQGQPLWALAGILLGWIALRSALFELPIVPPEAVTRLPSTIVGLVRTPPAELAATRIGASVAEPALMPPIAHREAGWPLLAPEVATPPPMQPALLPPLPRASSDTARRAAGHNLMWMAAMQAIPLLPEVAAALSGVPAAQLDRRPQNSRWSGDAWLAWRPGTSGLTAAAATPVYGAGQAGAVLRYDLAPGSPNRPAGYLRAVHALNGAPEDDLAAGLAVRPLAGVPVMAHGEARLSRRGSGSELRPAAFLSAGVDDAPLAAGVTVRGYAQGGYVGGRDATAFADGSLIADKAVWRDRDNVLSAGAGTWGGVQRGAGRLDLGPSASLRFRLGDGTARLSADYRLRIAGKAEPATGAALTLSAGF